VRGRASFFVDGSQPRRNKGDLLGSSTEKKKEGSICTFTHLPCRSLRSRREQHCTVGSIPASCFSSAPPDL
jgi:hypothetical protein